MFISDKVLIKLFFKYYKLAEKVNAEKFILKAEKLNKKLGLKFYDCYEFVRTVRRLKGIYKLFDLIDIRYDKKKDCYRCEVEFMKDLEPDMPGHRKRGRKLFSPKLYWRHLYPRYDNQKIRIMLEPYY